jgi:hypothetical protein
MAAMPQNILAQRAGIQGGQPPIQVQMPRPIASSPVMGGSPPGPVMPPISSVPVQGGMPPGYVGAPPQGAPQMGQQMQFGPQGLPGQQPNVGGQQAMMNMLRQRAGAVGGGLWGGQQPPAAPVGFRGF